MVGCLTSFFDVSLMPLSPPALCIQVLLLAVPGAELDQAVDAQGEAAVAVLRALGLPAIVVAVQGGGSTAGGPAAPTGMKERSAAKKRAEKAVSAQVRGRETLPPLFGDPHICIRPRCENKSLAILNRLCALS